jgi:thiosulfate reductase cytochrome b subunit
MRIHLSLLIAMSLHFVGDFMFQTENMSKNKSSDWSVLLLHSWVYATVLLVWVIYLGLIQPTKVEFLPLVYMVILSSHICIDGITSRVTHNFWDDGKYHEFFVTIGLDQLIHFSIILALSFYIL